MEQTRDELVPTDRVIGGAKEPHWGAQTSLQPLHAFWIKTES